MSLLKKKVISVSTVAFLALMISGIVLYFNNRAPVFPDLRKNLKNNKKENHISGIIEGEFTLRVNLPLNKNTLVRYIIPTDPQTGIPLKTASNIVFYAPFNGDAPLIRKKIKPWHRFFAEKFGFSVFTLTIEADTKIANDKTKYYIYKEAGWYELIFNIKKHLEKEFSLSGRPLLIVGESSGGSMAQQMVKAYPDRIAAAAWSGGSRYVPFSQFLNVPCLALNTWGCYGIPATLKMVGNARSFNIPIMHAETPSTLMKTGLFEHHAAGELTYELIQNFIVDVVSWRDQKNNQNYVPSDRFSIFWNKLPTDAVSKINSHSKDLILFPASTKPELIVFHVVKEFENRELLLKDYMSHLSNKKAVASAQYSGEETQEDSLRIMKSFIDICEKKEWKELPVIYIGEGRMGQNLLPEVLRLTEKRLKKVLIFNLIGDSLPNDLFVEMTKYPNTHFEIIQPDDVVILKSFPPNISFRKCEREKIDQQLWNFLNRGLGLKYSKTPADAPFPER